MEWLTNLLKDNPVATLSLPSVISGVTFLFHLGKALSDGVIDPTEYSQLIGSANGLETIFLVALMYALRKKNASTIINQNDKDK